MGPVSFESIDLGPDRETALTKMQTISNAGARAELLEREGRFVALVRTSDHELVRSLISADHTAAVFPPELEIGHLDEPLDATVVVPGSKSHTNRALVCAALADGRSTLDGVLLADDTEAMLAILSDLGIGVEIDREHRRVVVDGCGGDVPNGPVRLDARQSGTTSRFVLPMLTLGTGHYVLDGHEQMRARPFGDLIDALHTLGGRVEGSTLPLTVHGSGGLRGGSVEVPGSVSSQFLSGLLLSAPCADDVTVITITDELVSKPYIDLTLATMARFGAEVERDGHRRFVVVPTGYRPADLVIEPDASAASYFFALAAVTGGRVRIDGLGRDTLQGDITFVDVLEQMGATVVRGPDFTEVTGPEQLVGVTVDMADISDTAQSLAAIAPFATGPTRVTGIGFIRKKETDRIRAVVDQLRSIGIDADEETDGFVVRPGRPGPGRIATYDDHRMAMSFTVLGLAASGIVIENPGCVSKTFPDFFEVVAELRTR